MIRSLALVILLFVSTLFCFIEERFLVEIFPQRTPTVQWPKHSFFERWRERTIAFFGIDVDAGQFGILRSYGRPQRVYLAAPYDWGVAMRSGRISRICTYTYPGLKFSFDNGLLLLIEVTSRQRNFPLPIHVGDPEQRLYDMFGTPGWQYEYDGMRQVDYKLTGRLSVYIRQNKVTRIVWGVG